MTGKTLSHYEILEELGAGGMGVVYKGRDLKLDRLVALKFLISHLTRSPVAQLRFLREAKAISALNHPNIATIYEVDEAGDEAFLVLEYLPGGTLRTRLSELQAQGRKLSIAKLLEHAAAIAEGLAHAHRSGIIHRDIKPANLMFSAEGALKITDFGLSKFRGGPEITDADARVGTALFMAPEQLEGKDVDHRCDIFSFGIVLYEMAAGEPPFKGTEVAAVMHQILNAPAPPLSAVRPDAPPELDRIIQTALEKDREKRYQRTEDLLSDLKRLQRDQAALDSVTATKTLADIPSAILKQASSERTGAIGGGRRRLLGWGSAVAALILFALILLVLPFLFSPIRERASHWMFDGSIPAQKQIAVLPFQNVGGDAANQPFCDGLVEILTSMLTQLEQFHGSLVVVPASEVRKQSIDSAGAAHRAFGVNLVITGSVQRMGNDVRLTANLVDAKAMRQLASRTISSSLEKLPSLQDGVVKEVADLLAMQLQPKAEALLTAGTTAVAGAYDLYIQGQGFLQRWDRAGNIDKSIALFQRAYRQDPNYALAYAGLAESYRRKYLTTRDPQWLEQAQIADARALQLNDRIAPAHINLGSVYVATGRYEKGIEEFRRALDIDPVNADAYRELANAYEAQGRLQDAEGTYQKAIQLRAGDWQIQNMLGAFYYRQARYREAEPCFRRMTELSPDNSVGYRNLGGLYFLMDRYDDAAKALHRSLAIQPSASAYSNLGTIYFFQGRYREAVREYERARGLNQNNNYTFVGNLADAYRWTPELAEKAPNTYRHAIELTQRELATNPKNARALGSQAVYRAKLAEKEQALSDITKAVQLASGDRNVGYQSVLVYELAGQRDRALAALESVVKAGYSMAEIRRDPELEQLRKSSRFQILISRFRE